MGVYTLRGAVSTGEQARLFKSVVGGLRIFCNSLHSVQRVTFGEPPLPRLRRALTSSSVLQGQISRNSLGTPPTPCQAKSDSPDLLLFELRSGHLRPCGYLSSPIAIDSHYRATALLKSLGSDLFEAPRSVQWTQLEGSEETGSTGHSHGDAQQEYRNLPRAEGVIPHHRIEHNGLYISSILRAIWLVRSLHRPAVSDENISEEYDFYRAGATVRQTLIDLTQDEHSMASCATPMSHPRDCPKEPKT